MPTGSPFIQVQVQAALRLERYGSGQSKKDGQNESWEGIS